MLAAETQDNICKKMREAILVNKYWLLISFKTGGVYVEAVN